MSLLRYASTSTAVRSHKNDGNVHPGLGAAIYAALYDQTISDVSTSWFGGQPSRIIPLWSNRLQDYGQSCWQLGTASVGRVLHCRRFADKLPAAAKRQRSKQSCDCSHWAVCMSPRYQNCRCVTIRPVGFGGDQKALPRRQIESRAEKHSRRTPVSSRKERPWKEASGSHIDDQLCRCCRCMASLPRGAAAWEQRLPQRRCG